MNETARAQTVSCHNDFEFGSLFQSIKSWREIDGKLREEGKVILESSDYICL